MVGPLRVRGGECFAAHLVSPPEGLPAGASSIMPSAARALNSAPIFSTGSCSSRLVLQNPVAGELAALDVRKDLAHPLPNALVYDLRPGGVVTILGGVRDRVPHLGEATLVDEVQYKLQLVNALVVRELRLVPGLDKRIEPGFQERREPAAEHRLLPEEVCLGLLGKGGLDDTGPAAPDTPRVGEDQVP